MPPQPPSSTLFPYTTLFRSLPLASAAHGAALGLEPPERPVAARSTAEVALRNPQGSGFHHQRCSSPTLGSCPIRESADPGTEKEGFEPSMETFIPITP